MEHQFEPHQPVVVRLNPNGNNRWFADFFSFYDESLTLPYVCVGSHWAECLPAEGNEHLIGTTNDPAQPEQEFQFGDHVEVRDEDPEKWRSARYIVKDNEEIYPHRVFLKDDKCTVRFKCCRHAKGNDITETIDNATPPEPKFEFGDKVEIRNTDEEDWTPAIYVDKSSFINKMLKYEVILQRSHRTTHWLQCRHAEGDK